MHGCVPSLATSPLLCAVGRGWEDVFLILQHQSTRSRWAEPVAESASSPHRIFGKGDEMLEAWTLAGLMLGPDPGMRLVLAAGPQPSLQGGLSPMDPTEEQCESVQSYTDLVLAPGDAFVSVRSLLSCSHHCPQGLKAQTSHAKAAQVSKAEF